VRCSGTSDMSLTAPGRSSSSRATRPRVLVATPGEIAYDTNAGHARLWSIVQALSAEGADVGYFGIWPLAHRRYATAMAALGIQVLAERPPRHDLADEAARRRGGPDATARRFAAAIETFAPTHIYLYLHFTGVELLDVARSTAPTAAHVLDAVDVLFRQEWAEPNSSPMTEATELALYGRCDAVLVDSRTDAATLRSRQLDTSVIVAPLTYDARPGPSWAERKGVLFAGTSDHPPNVDAIRWFVTDILPAVQEHLAAPTTIVGSDRDHLYSELAGPDVTVVGWVPDLDDVMDAHRLAIAPLRQGGGLRGKVLEALSVGLPVVTTDVAAYGIPPADNGELIGGGAPCDEKAFADVLVATYSDEHTWRDQRDRGLQIIGRHFSRERLHVAAARILNVSNTQ
jgi:O-antigen biosynthesis protein